jgi:phosphoglycerate dehydrogenase-like enzyme
VQIPGQTAGQALGQISGQIAGQIAGAPLGQIAVLPEGRAPWLQDAVLDGGGTVTDDLDAADGIVWADPRAPDALAAVLAQHPQIPWVQLPFAGIDNFRHVLDHDRLWSCGKGVYAEPVAEMALALALACCRDLDGYARATTWGSDHGRNLLGARVTVLGGGEITASFLRLIAPFRCHTTVVTRHPRPRTGADEVVGAPMLHEVAARTDVLVLALALTPETEGIVGTTLLAALPDHAVVVNVARGAHVDTDALVAALRAGTLGGAGLDVTAPEPLPDGHPLWTTPGVLITPHTANTQAMGRPLLAARVRENVIRRIAGEPLLGPVDVDLGY